MKSRIHKRMPHGHRPAGADKGFAPKAHVLIGWHGVPIHKGDSQVVFRGSKDLDCERVRLVVDQAGGNVKFIRPKSPGNLFAVGNLFSIEPDIGPIVDALKVQPVLLALLCCGNTERSAIPPGTVKGTIFRYRQVRELSADRITHTWHLAQVHARVRVRIILDLVGHQVRHHRPRYLGRIPLMRLEQ